MPKHGKRYEAAIALVEKGKFYEPLEAVGLAKQGATAKFDETVELHLKTGLDPRHADQQVRGTAMLPHGLGKTIRVLVFAEGDAAREAESAGAAFVGGDELIKRVEDGFTDFDVALSQRELMGKVGKLGRVLGPRGLMPNPRSNTVVEAADMAKAVRDAQQGRVEFRLDRTALIHVPIGKASFSEDQLIDNMATVMEAVVGAKPAGAKGQYIRSVNLTTTMGPGIPVDVNPAMNMKPS
jgi:large subunit ribosomal protein L1